ncbi:unnamed protein product [Ixodes pacificus]
MGFLFNDTYAAVRFCGQSRSVESLVPGSERGSRAGSEASTSSDTETSVSAWDESGRSHSCRRP